MPYFTPDLSTNSNDGELSAMDIPTDVILDDVPQQGYADFDGTADHVTMGAGASALDMAVTQAFSVCLYYYQGDSSGVVIGKRLSSTTLRGWEIYVTNLATYFILCDTNGTSTLLQVHLPSLNNRNFWNHLVFTYDGSSNASGVKCYVNGADASSLLVTDVDNLTVGSTTTEATAVASIGRRDAANNDWLGRVAEAQVYSKALSASEALEAYGDALESDPRDSSMSANLVGYWRFYGGGAVYPTIKDLSSSGNDGTMTNMTAGDLVAWTEATEPGPAVSIQSVMSTWSSSIVGVSADVAELPIVAVDAGFTAEVVLDVTAPVIANISPSPGASIDAGDSIALDVTDDSGAFARVMIVAFFEKTGIEEVVHDGSEFRGLYAVSESTRQVIADGYSYSFVRHGGWPSGQVTFRVFAIDSSGNEAN